MSRAECEQFEADRDREYPVCPTCEGRIGWDCVGHCVECGFRPEDGEDFCAACAAKMNGGVK